MTEKDNFRAKYLNLIHKMHTSGSPEELEKHFEQVTSVVGEYRSYLSVKEMQDSYQLIRIVRCVEHRKYE